MAQADCRFLHWSRRDRCTAAMDKRFQGYSTLQHIAAGRVEVAYAGHWQTFGPGWCWPHHPGPRIALRPGADPGWWSHRHIAVAGAQVEAWRQEGLWPGAPQACPPGWDAAAAFDELMALLPADGPLRHRHAVNRLEGILLVLAEARRASDRPAWLLAAQAALAAPAGFHADIAAAAQAAGMPPSTFRRRFAAALGCSPQSYALAARLDRARQQLAEGDEPIAAIAESLGYADVFFFTRQFRRVVGLPPAAYRRSVREGG